MKRYIFILIICLSAQSAFAQQIRDMSLPPDESLQLPDVSNGDNSRYLQFPNQENGISGLSGIRGGYSSGGYHNNGYPSNDSYNSEPASSFMDEFCDPSFHPVVANDCTEQHKQHACEIFSKLPAVVKRLLDDTISCMYSANEDDNPRNAKAEDCSANDSERLRLLRRYWQDQATAEALVFLPEDALNPGDCMRGGN